MSSKNTTTTAVFCQINVNSWDKDNPGDFYETWQQKCYKKTRKKHFYFNKAPSVYKSFLGSNNFLLQCSLCQSEVNNANKLQYANKMQKLHGNKTVYNIYPKKNNNNKWRMYWFQEHLPLPGWAWIQGKYMATNNNKFSNYCFLSSLTWTEASFLNNQVRLEFSLWALRSLWKNSGLRTWS